MFCSIALGAARRGNVIAVILLSALFVTLLIPSSVAISSDPAPAQPTPLDNAFKTLPRLELGQSLGAFHPIDQAVTRSHSDESVRKDLERRLLDVLKADSSTRPRQRLCMQAARDRRLRRLAGHFGPAPLQPTIFLHGTLRDGGNRNASGQKPRFAGQYRQRRPLKRRASSFHSAAWRTPKPSR